TMTPSLAELQAAPGQLRNKELVMLRNTRPFNVYGLPSISLNCGFSKSGLPIGLQITGVPGAEGAVLALAHAYQQQSAWHKKIPGLRNPTPWESLLPFDSPRHLHAALTIRRCNAACSPLHLTAY